MSTPASDDASVNELARFLLDTDLAQYPATLDCAQVAAVFGCAVGRVHKRGASADEAFPPALKRDGGAPKWSRALVALWIARQGMQPLQPRVGGRRGPKSTATKAAKAAAARAPVAPTAREEAA